MTEEEKTLLIKVLAEQSPYGLKVRKANTNRRTVRGVDAIAGIVHFENDTISPFGLDIEHPLTFRQQVKPYLRPMSSMTESEEGEYNSLNGYERGVFPSSADALDWLNAHHFDWRGLIQKGLAAEAEEGMYN